MKAIYILCLLFLNYSSYNNTKHKDNCGLLKSKYFETEFLNKFKILQLPCVIGEAKNIDLKSLIKTDPASLDSLITLSEKMFCYGMLADTSKFITLIFYAQAEKYIPVLITYDKHGNEISNEGIDFGCWDGGPCIYKCDGHIRITKSLTINIEHVTTCFSCNDSVYKKPLRYPESRNGKILKNGSIVIEKQKYK
ncbi:MAG: hypothetical protein NTY07_02820 [Bacteroidia bacterium]|nr:hypothetical protein [Bacteroidia bacterium]